MTVYKLDRIYRNKYETAIHRKHLKDNGVNVISAMENITETPKGVPQAIFQAQYKCKPNYFYLKLGLVNQMCYNSNIL